METESESIKLLARKISRLQIAEYNKVKEGMCSGSIQPSKIGQIMSASQCGKNNIEKAELENITSSPPLTKFYFFVTVKNLNNGEECMHKTPLESLKDWQHKFLEEPIFKNINLVDKPHFPELLEPTPGSLMWTHTLFSKGGTQFVVIATLTYPPSLSSRLYLPSLDSDYIVINAVSPLLPSTHATYSQLQTSQLRRSCALQYAFMALAEQYGFEIKGSKDFSSIPSGGQSELLPYAMISSVLHGNQVIQGSDWCKYNISGVISSPGAERNAGTNTIPATLQSLHFLLFGLDAQDSVSYDIIQPHKYGYIFQLKNLAGWCLNAGVNMYGTYNVINSMFQDRGLPSSKSTARIGNGEILSALSYDVIKNSLKLVYVAKEKAEQDYKASLRLWSDAPVGMKSSLSNIETVTLESERNKIPSYIWQHMLRYIGLNLISDKLAGEIVLLDQKIEIQRGNVLLNALIKGYGNTSSLSSSDGAIDIINMSNTISVIFDVCKGIAAEMVHEHKTPKKLHTKLKKSAKNDIPLDPTKVILFLNQCIGLPPDTWFKNASPYLFEDPTEFTRFILTDVNQYNIFYPTNSWGDSAVFKSYILKSSSFNHSIANAKKLAKELEKSGLYSKTWIDDSRTFLLTRALAYVILTGDDEKLMSNWND